MADFLVFENISKHFGITRAVDQVTLGISKGEVFSLLGPSGCGKTTLLRLAAGFEAPTAGRVLLEGKDLTSLPPNERPVNTVFQNYALFPHLNVRENIAFGLRVAGKKKMDVDREVGGMLEMIQLIDHAHKMPSQLSGGQKQRVAIARALVNKPRVLLLDEPLAALDLKLRQRMLLELSAIHREVGSTFIYVTHDQTEAMSLSNRIAVMNQGRVEQCGTPSDLYERPASAFVASFIGDTNMLKGVVMEGHGDTCRVRLLDGTQLWVRCEAPLESLVQLSLRPERVTITTKPTDQHDPEDRDGNALMGTVDEVAYLGSAIRCWIDTGSVRLCAEITLHRSGHECRALQRGQRVGLSFSADDVTVVDAQS